MSKDYYTILGVAEFDTPENIKNAYRKLARKWHPDVAGNTQDVLNRFKEINEAYEILSDATKKDEYDRARRFYNYAKNNSNNDNNVKDTSSATTNPQDKKSGFNFNWEEFISKKMKENSFKKEETHAPVKGDDVYSDIEITIIEAINGTNKTINMLQTRICPKCKGRKFANASVCPHCGGKGNISDYKKFNIKIPAGVKDKSKIRLAGEGGLGAFGGNNGDLYITIHIKEEHSYKTEGLNIYKTVYITPYEAVLGTETSISTLEGSVLLKISPKTQNGQKFRLSACGLVQNDKIGDMIVTVEIRIPEDITSEEIDLYKKLQEISSSNNRNSTNGRQS